MDSEEKKKYSREYLGTLTQKQLIDKIISLRGLLRRRQIKNVNLESFNKHILMQITYIKNRLDKLIEHPWSQDHGPKN
jgi:hypothetical protein